MMWRRTTMTLMVMLLAACGEGPAGTCDWGVANLCVEEDGDIEDARAICEGINGRFDEGRVCPSTGRLGGCRTELITPDGAPVVETVWYYQGHEGVSSQAEVRDKCSRLGAEFVPPG